MPTALRRGPGRPCPRLPASTSCAVGSASAATTCTTSTAAASRPSSRASRSLAQARREWKLCTDLELAPALERVGKLEGEERVAARRLPDPHEQRSREGRAEAGSADSCIAPMRGPAPRPVEGSTRRSHSGGIPGRPARRRPAHRESRERRTSGGRAMRRRATGGHRPRCTPGRRARAPSPRRERRKQTVRSSTRTCRVRRRAEVSTARRERRQPWKHVVGDVGQKIGEPGVGIPRLALARPCRERPDASLRGGRRGRPTTARSCRFGLPGENDRPERVHPGRRERGRSR